MLQPARAAETNAMPIIARSFIKSPRIAHAAAAANFHSIITIIVRIVTPVEVRRGKGRTD